MGGRLNSHRQDSKSTSVDNLSPPSACTVTEPLSGFAQPKSFTSMPAGNTMWDPNSAASYSGRRPESILGLPFLFCPPWTMRRAIALTLCSLLALMTSCSRADRGPTPAPPPRRGAPNPAARDNRAGRRWLGPGVRLGGIALLVHEKVPRILGVRLHRRGGRDCRSPRLAPPDPLA